MSEADAADKNAAQAAEQDAAPAPAEAQPDAAAPAPAAAEYKAAALGEDEGDTAADDEVAAATASSTPEQARRALEVATGEDMEQQVGRRRASTPSSPALEIAHEFQRRAEVERIPSQTAQPKEGTGGLRLWVTRARDRPPAAERKLALLKAAEDAEEEADGARLTAEAARHAADEAGEGEDKAALEAAAAEAEAAAKQKAETATKARAAAPDDADETDWEDEAHAPYSLDEQIEAVKRATHDLSRPAVSAEGWLRRVKAKERTSKSRYFVLTPKALVYFAQAAHAKVSPSGYLLAEWDFPSLPSRISLRSHGARIWLSEVTAIRTSTEAKTITLARPEANGGDVVIEAASEADLEAWTDAIEECRTADDDGDSDDDGGGGDGGDAAASSSSSSSSSAAAEAEAKETPTRTRRPTLLGRMFGRGGGSSDSAAGDTKTAGDGEAGGEEDAAAAAAAAAAASGGGDGEAEAGTARRGTLLGRMLGRAPVDEKTEAERKAKAEQAEAERKAKAEEAAKARAVRQKEAAAYRAKKEQQRRERAEEAAHRREVDRKKSAILAKQHRADEEKRRAEMSLEAVLKLKAETEAKHRPTAWRAPDLSEDATDEEIAMTPTLQTLPEDRFRSYLEDRDANPVALLRGWMTKDAESAVSMGVAKSRYFVLTPYYLAYFCSEADAAITARGYVKGKAMGEKPRRLMRLGARIGLEHIVDVTANVEEDETDDVLGDLDTGAALAAERGDAEAAAALQREAHERKRRAQVEASGGLASPLPSAGDDEEDDDDDDGEEEGGGGDEDASGKAARSGAGGRKQQRDTRNGKGMMARTSEAAAASSSSSSSSSAGAGAGGRGRIARGSSFAGKRLRDGRCVTPPKPRTKPPAPEAPPPGLATRLMLKKARARLGSEPRLTGTDAAMPRVESATLTIDLSDRVLRLQCYKVAYRDEWVRMIDTWRTWWRKRQEQIQLDQFAQAAAYRQSQAAVGMSRADALRKRKGGAGGGTTGAAGRRGGRRYVGGRGKGLPSK